MIRGTKNEHLLLLGEMWEVLGKLSFTISINVWNMRRCAVQVPYRLLSIYHKIQSRLVRELEKKFSGRDVVIIANRKVLPVPKTNFTRARPQSRTLTAVSETAQKTCLYCKKN